MIKFLLVSLFAGIIISCQDNKTKTPKETITSVRMLTSPASDSSAEPYLTTDKNGLVYLSWIEKNGRESFLKFSVLDSNQWSTPVTIVSGDDILANWADYPTLTSNGGGYLMAHYPEKSDTESFTYNIKIIFSSDSGKTWSRPAILNDDKVKAEYGFVSMKPYSENYFAAWLDGRKTGMDMNIPENGHENHQGGMTLRAALLDKNGKATIEWELDDRVCDCCQTSAAITGNGPVVVYRDRSEDEVRDISVVRFVNGKWSSPKIVYADNWKIKACPVNGPRISAMGNNLAVAWFSMKDNKGEVKASFSKNAGESFSEPIHIDEGNPIGRVGIVMLDTATALVSWMEDSNIKAIKIYNDGRKEKPFLIAASSNKRASGFPQVIKTGSKIYFAWTDDSAKTIRIAFCNTTDN